MPTTQGSPPERIDDRFVVHPMEPVAVKGKTELLQTFTVETYQG